MNAKEFDAFVEGVKVSLSDMERTIAAQDKRLKTLEQQVRRAKQTADRALNVGRGVANW